MRLWVGDTVAPQIQRATCVWSELPGVPDDDRFSSNSSAECDFKLEVRLKLRVSTRATVEVHQFYPEVPQFGSSRPLSKTDLEKNKL